MFDLNNFYDFKDLDDGSDNERKVNLFSIYFKRFNSYNKKWKVQQILLYEYFLICARKYGHTNFTQKMTFIVNATRLSKDTIIKYIDFFEELGILTVHRNSTKGVKHLNRYGINYDVIKNKLEIIYNFEGLPEGDKKAYVQWLGLYYDYHSSGTYTSFYKRYK